MPELTQQNVGEVRLNESRPDVERCADHRPRYPLMDPLERQNAELRKRNELLEERIRQLQKTLAPRLLFPLNWRLNRGETTVLACLYTSPDGFRSNSMLKTCAESFSASSGSCEMASVRIFNLRNKLRGFGIRIITRHGEGYTLPSDAHKIIEVALKKENE